MVVSTVLSTIPGKLLLQDLIVLSLHAGLLDQPLVVEGKRRRKSTETFAIKHEAKRPVVKVATLCYIYTRGSQFVLPCGSICGWDQNRIK